MGDVGRGGGPIPASGAGCLNEVLYSRFHVLHKHCNISLLLLHIQVSCNTPNPSSQVHDIYVYILVTGEIGFCGNI